MTAEVNEFSNIVMRCSCSTHYGMDAPVLTVSAKGQIPVRWNLSLMHYKCLVLQDASINLGKIRNLGIKHNIWRAHKTSGGGEFLELVVKSAMASSFFATRVF